MNQKNLIVGTFCLIVLIYGTIVGYDLFNKSRIKKNKETAKSNWEWSNDWNKIDVPEKPEAPKPEAPKPEAPKPDASQIVAKDYQEALTKSEELGMPILLFFEAEWCTWCKKLKNETLTDAGVKTIMKNYIFVEVNADQNKELVKEFGVKYLPYYVITNSEKKNLKADGGFKNAQEFSAWLDNSIFYKQPKKSLPKSKVEPENLPKKKVSPESPIQKSALKEKSTSTSAKTYYYYYPTRTYYVPSYGGFIGGGCF